MRKKDKARCILLPTLLLLSLASALVANRAWCQGDDPKPAPMLLPLDAPEQYAALLQDGSIEARRTLSYSLLMHIERLNASCSGGTGSRFTGTLVNLRALALAITLQEQWWRILSHIRVRLLSGAGATGVRDWRSAVQEVVDTKLPEEFAEMRQDLATISQAHKYDLYSHFLVAGFIDAVVMLLHVRLPDFRSVEEFFTALDQRTVTTSSSFEGMTDQIGIAETLVRHETANTARSSAEGYQPLLNEVRLLAARLRQVRDHDAGQWHTHLIFNERFLGLSLQVYGAYGVMLRQALELRNLAVVINMGPPDIQSIDNIIRAIILIAGRGLIVETDLTNVAAFMDGMSAPHPRTTMNLVWRALLGLYEERTEAEELRIFERIRAVHSGSQPMALIPLAPESIGVLLVEGLRGTRTAREMVEQSLFMAGRVLDDEQLKGTASIGVGHILSNRMMDIIGTQDRVLLLIDRLPGVHPVRQLAGRYPILGTSPLIGR